MTDEFFTEDKKSKIQPAIIIIIVLTIIIASAYLTLSSAKIENTPPIEQKTYTQTYYGISSEQLKQMIDNKESIIIIDTRPCPCNYNSGHIPTSKHCTNPEVYYNYTIKILAYDQDGNHESIDICEKLIGNTYNDIYYLIGGINAWKNAGYEIIK